MSVPGAKILLAVSGPKVWVKVVGKASFSVSVDLKTALQSLVQRGHTEFIFDLSECPLMDSTFMGVMAGFGMERAAGAFPCLVKLVNPAPRVADLLESLGVAHLFTLVRGEAVPPAPGPLLEASSAAASKTEVSKTCLEAHEILMSLNPANVAKFKDVAQFLAEDIRRMESEKNP
ncbi:MAG: STAS domain-containing protein [Verrucomicrobia bacterium]|nr:STAS domain-containing protein [Verrucomicrobiota bacterium]